MDSDPMEQADILFLRSWYARCHFRSASRAGCDPESGCRSPTIK